MFESSPAATIILLLTSGVSLYALYQDNSLIHKFILHPYNVIHNNRWVTIITSSFIHADLYHLLFNMISFYFFAFSLEVIVGSGNFLIIYFSSMILADIPTIIKHKNDYNYRSLGASGAVSGVIYSFIVFFPKGTIYAMFIPMPAIVFAILFLLYGWWMNKRGIDYINHSAHNWGALSGFVITILLIPGAFNHFINQLF